MPTTKLISCLGMRIQVEFVRNKAVLVAFGAKFCQSCVWSLNVVLSVIVKL